MAMTKSSAERVRLGPQGRVVIPAALRRALSLAEGDRLVMRAEGRSLRVERVADVKTRLKSSFAHLRGKVSLAEELIAERRQEARREARKS